MLWGNGSRVGVGAVYTAAAALVAYRCGFGAGVVSAVLGDIVLRLTFPQGPFQIANPGELIILAGMIVCCYVAAGRGKDSVTGQGGGTTIISEAARVREWAMMRLALCESVRGREIGVACTAAAIPTLAGAGILLFTRSTVGIGGLYALAIGMAARFGSRRAALVVAFISMLAINYFAGPTHWQFSMPTVNETILYGALVGIAFFLGQATAQPPKPPRSGGGGLAMLADVNGHKFDIRHVDYNAGSYAFDCEAGAQKARKQVHEIIVRRSPEILIWQVRDMVGRGRWTGEEIGYVSALARHLSGSMPVERQDDSDDLHS